MRPVYVFPFPFRPQIWRILPSNIVRLNHQAFVSVHHEYRRRRIANKIFANCEAALRRMDGIQGAFVEVTAIGSQKVSRNEKTLNFYVIFYHQKIAHYQF